MANTIVRTSVVPGKSSKLSFPAILLDWASTSVHNGRDTCTIGPVQVVVEVSETDIENINESLGLNLTRAELILMMAGFGIKVE